MKVSADAEADDLPEGLSICLYRVAQEALQNVARHAQAKTVHVDLRQNLDRLVLSVHDDGIGFDIGERSRSGDGRNGGTSSPDRRGLAGHVQTRKGHNGSCAKSRSRRRNPLAGS